MLSLRRSMREIDETEAANRAAAKAFADAVETSAKHVVEVDPDEAHRFRSQVLGLAERLGSPTIHDLDAARQSFQSELQAYAQKASEDVHRMREDLKAAAQAMQSFAESMTGSGANHEQVLQREFSTLTRAADSDDIRAVRATIHQTIAAVSASYQELKQSHQTVIAQLRDEIRVLQQTRAHESTRPVATPSVLDKAAIDRRVEELLRRRQPFGLVLAGIPDWHEHCRTLNPQVTKRAMDELAEGLRARIDAHGSIGGSDAVAAWSPGACAGLISTDRPCDLEAWTRQLGFCLVYQQAEKPHTLSIRPNLLLVPHAPADSPTLFFSRLSDATNQILNPPL